MSFGSSTTLEQPLLTDVHGLEGEVLVEFDVRIRISLASISTFSLKISLHPVKSDLFLSLERRCTWYSLSASVSQIFSLLEVGLFS